MRSVISKYGPALLAAFVAILILAVDAGWAQSDESAGRQPEKSLSAGKAASATFASGQKVGIDPRTKKIRELTPEEARALSEDMKNFLSTADEVRIYRFPNGMVAAELTEDYMNSTVAKRNPDGTLTLGSAGGLKAAEDLVKSDPAVSSSKPEPEEK